jgi:hypothetical protein
MNLYEIKALTAHNKINDLVSKTAVTLNHVFADNAARDAYFVTNPTELVDNLFIKVDTGYQQYINSAWENTEAVIVEQLPAKQQSIEDTDNLYTATNVEDALKEVKTDLETHKLDYMPHRIQDLKNNKIYKYSLQMSEDGQPQIKFEEVI